MPADTPVTKPVLSTVATAGVPDTQAGAAAAVAEPVNCVVKPIQTVNVPVIVGSAFIVTVAVCLQPFVFV